MKITRNVNGSEKDFELTAPEVLAAYHEQLHQFDMEEVIDEFLSNSDWYQKQLKLDDHDDSEPFRLTDEEVDEAATLYRKKLNRNANLDKREEFKYAILAVLCKRKVTEVTVKRYMLWGCRENDALPPEFFTTLKEAQFRMRTLFEGPLGRKLGDVAISTYEAGHDLEVEDSAGETAHLCQWTAMVTDYNYSDWTWEIFDLLKLQEKGTNNE